MLENSDAVSGFPGWKSSKKSWCCQNKDVACAEHVPCSARGSDRSPLKDLPVKSWCFFQQKCGFNMILRRVHWVSMNKKEYNMGYIIYLLKIHTQAIIHPIYTIYGVHYTVWCIIYKKHVCFGSVWKWLRSVF